MKATIREHPALLWKARNAERRGRPPDPQEVRVASDDTAGPVCLSGACACPPEDCGGVQGYYQTLEILRDPRHEEYQDRKTWIESMTGGLFDPAAFDVEVSSPRELAAS